MNERFQIQRVGMEDVDEIVEMITSSFQHTTSPRLLLEFSGVSPSALLEWRTAGLGSELQACLASEGKASMYKIIDTHSSPPKIAAFAVWCYDESATDTLFQKLHGKASTPLPEGTNTGLRNRFSTELSEMERRLRPKGRYFELLDLLTSPLYRHLGLARLLLNIGLSRADSEKLPCYLSGSPMGVPVYLKAGFVEVGKLSIGLEEYGGKAFEGIVHEHVGMIREPVSEGEGRKAI